MSMPPLPSVSISANRRLTCAAVTMPMSRPPFQQRRMPSRNSGSVMTPSGPAGRDRHFGARASVGARASAERGGGRFWGELRYAFLDLTHRGPGRTSGRAPASGRPPLSAPRPWPRWWASTAGRRPVPARAFVSSINLVTRAGVAQVNLSHNRGPGRQHGNARLALNLALRILSSADSSGRFHCGTTCTRATAATDAATVGGPNRRHHQNRRLA
jgi:hypothetical protein